MGWFRNMEVSLGSLMTVGDEIWRSEAFWLPSGPPHGVPRQAGIQEGLEIQENERNISP